MFHLSFSSRRSAILLNIALVLSSIMLYSQEAAQEELCRQSLAESLIPVRPGIPGHQPFWNEKATVFQYVPSFSFNNSTWVITNPAYYRYTAFSFTDKKEYTFTASSPNEPLTPIWEQLPEGRVWLRVEAFNQEGNNSVLTGERVFYKKAPFCPPYPAAKYSFRESLEKGLNFVMNQPHIQAWLTEGKPVHTLHPLYCYSALEVGSVIDAMLLYHKHYPDNKDALLIARKAADYLIAHAEPAGSPLEGFPQTYEGDHLAAARYKGQMMTTQAAFAGQSYFSLFKTTGDTLYLNAARRIAETYLHTQLPEGTWYLKVYSATGRPVKEIKAIPIVIAQFLYQLSGELGRKDFAHAADKAIQWIWEHPMRDFNWSGQFEDVEPGPPYQNLSKYEASWFAQYLLENLERDTAYLPMAQELIAFCEDQFVMWKNPQMYDNWGNSTATWRTPSVLEQYNCYVPIDASSVQMIRTYLKAYQATGAMIYKEKAMALAHQIVNAQEDSGRIPTFWVEGFTEFWHNCMVSDLVLLDELDSWLELNK